MDVDKLGSRRRGGRGRLLALVLEMERGAVFVCCVLCVVVLLCCVLCFCEKMEGGGWID